ncbi:hypothetical protein AB0M97_16415 [Streptomyces sp. NPDC051207]|uniref:hypothetical protein n=1 Tax=Streptomyces sp. NPDC051207 TaxID=3154641 RepID=UPI00343A704B
MRVNARPGHRFAVADGHPELVSHPEVVAAAQSAPTWTAPSTAAPTEGHYTVLCSGGGCADVSPENASRW